MISMNVVMKNMKLSSKKSDTREKSDIFKGSSMVDVGLLPEIGLLPAASRLPVASQTLVQSFVAPPGKVCLLYGDSLVFQFSLKMAAYAMAQGKPIAVVDGCNRFNVHLLSRFARERRIDPDDFLRRIYISRGFTCYQMEQAVSSRLPPFLELIDSNIAMIFGLLDTFYDEQASFREVQQILRRLLGTFAEIRTKGVSVLLACTEWNVLPKERNQLFATLKTGADTIYRLTADADNKPTLFLEKAADGNRSVRIGTDS